MTESEIKKKKAKENFLIFVKIKIYFNLLFFSFLVQFTVDKRI